MSSHNERVDMRSTTTSFEGSVPPVCWEDRFLEDMYASGYYYSPLGTRASSSSPFSDSQSLEARFLRLEVSDSNPRLMNNLTSNRSPFENRARGGYLFPSNSQQESAREQINYQPQRLLFPPDICVNGYDAHNKSYSYDFHRRNISGVMGSTNACLNRNLVDVPSSPSNSFLDQSPWDYSRNDVSRFRNGGGSFHYHDPYSTRNHRIFPMENGMPTLLSRAKDRVESQQLQEEIEKGSREAIDKIFDNLISHVLELMVDSCGHLVFQKLLKKCTDEQITKVLDMVIQQPQQLVNVCFDSHGSHAIQDLMRCFCSEEQILRFMESLSYVGFLLSKNTNANSIIVFCFNHFSHSQIRCLLQVIVENCYQIAIDEHGCCMLQQCIGKSFGEVRNSLIRQIIINALRLCVNCYGNYVVQYVLDLEDPRVADALSTHLVGHYVQLSYDKYGSHAVQKCLRSRVFNSRRIIQELLLDIESLLVNPYGNYVIQTAWTVSQADIRHQLYFRIKQNYSYMKYNRYGRKVLEKLNLWT